jgi:hypothetical protein
MSSSFVDLSANNPETQVGQHSFFNRTAPTPVKVAVKPLVSAQPPGGSVGTSGACTACGGH